MSTLITKNRIILIGFMGAGKSAVGIRVASLLQIPFTDLDNEIESREGMTIPHIFKQKGESYFRQVEKRLLQEFLLDSPEAVIAVGGGAVMHEELWHRKSGEIIYLQGSLDLLFRRAGQNKGDRPLLQSFKEFEQLFYARQPLYEKADLTMNIDNKSPENIASELAKAWKINHGHQNTT